MDIDGLCDPFAIAEDVSLKRHYGRSSRKLSQDVVLISVG